MVLDWMLAIALPPVCTRGQSYGHSKEPRQVFSNFLSPSMIWTNILLMSVG